MNSHISVVKSAINITVPPPVYPDKNRAMYSSVALVENVIRKVLALKSNIEICYQHFSLALLYMIHHTSWGITITASVFLRPNPIPIILRKIVPTTAPIYCEIPIQTTSVGASGGTINGDFSVIKSFEFSMNHANEVPNDIFIMFPINQKIEYFKIDHGDLQLKI